jgi:hypothetical protein
MMDTSEKGFDLSFTAELVDYSRLVYDPISWYEPWPRGR